MLPDDHHAPRSTLDPRRADDISADPAPPPPMPTAAPRLVPQSGPAGAAPSGAPGGDGWAVDPDQLDRFIRAVDHTRRRLRRVQDVVERIGSGSYTPNLGISPVGQQLQKKFADRLDAPPDDPQSPTSGGLRPMLAEAIRRMDEFITGAESAVKAYQEADDTGDRRLSATGPSD